MGGKAAEMGAEEAWSDDLSEEEREDFELFEDMDEDMDDEFEHFGEPGPNTREQFEAWEDEEHLDEESVWEDEA